MKGRRRIRLATAEICQIGRLSQRLPPPSYQGECIPFLSGGVRLQLSSSAHYGDWLGHFTKLRATAEIRQRCLTEKPRCQVLGGKLSSSNLLLKAASIQH